MRKQYIARHFINNPASLEEFKERMIDLEWASEYSQSKALGLNFGLKLTVDESKMDSYALGCLRSQVFSSLPRNFWLLYDSVDRGPGTSFRQVLFNPSFSDSPTLVGMGCLDQFLVDSPEALEQLNELYAKVEKDLALYANGSRDVPVVLASHPRNSNLRTIHELFHSLAIGSRKLRVPESREGVTPAYREIGESTSGFYIINHAHPAFPELSRALASASRQNGMTGFATDYFTSLYSSRLGEFATGYIPSKKNKFYEQKDEAQELEAVRKLVVGQTSALRSTEVRHILASTLRDPWRVNRISDFYPRQDVELVKCWMRQGLTA